MKTSREVLKRIFWYYLLLFPSKLISYCQLFVNVLEANPPVFSQTFLPNDDRHFEMFFNLLKTSTC